MGIKFLSGKEQDADIDELKRGDVVIIPAFGAETSTMQELEERGCFVRGHDLRRRHECLEAGAAVHANDSVTSIIHGKAWHEETKATSSRATAKGGADITWWCSPWRRRTTCAITLSEAATKRNFWSSSKALIPGIRSGPPLAGGRRRQPNDDAAWRDGRGAAAAQGSHGEEIRFG